jgi:hypothetical protein
MAGGVVDTLRIVYEVDVVDKGTKQLLASEQRVHKGVVQTTRAFGQQDAAQKRSATVATAAATKRVAAQLKVTRADAAAAKATDAARAADVRRREALLTLSAAEARHE